MVVTRKKGNYTLLVDFLHIHVMTMLNACQLQSKEPGTLWIWLNTSVFV